MAIGTQPPSDRPSAHWSTPGVSLIAGAAGHWGTQEMVACMAVVWSSSSGAGLEADGEGQCQRFKRRRKGCGTKMQRRISGDTSPEDLNRRRSTWVALTPLLGVVLILGIAVGPAGANSFRTTHGHAVAPTTGSGSGIRHPSVPAGPLNVVHLETWFGNDPTPIVGSAPTTVRPQYDGSRNLSAVWAPTGEFTAQPNSAIVPGASYDLSSPNQFGVTASGSECDSTDGSATMTVDQFTLDFSGAVTSLAVQFDCVTNDGSTEIEGTYAYNASPSSPGEGYYLYGDDGSLAGFGNDSFLDYLGDLSTTPLNKPVVGMAITPSGAGYWMVAGDGGVFSFGDAAFYGSTGNLRLNRPVLGMAATPDGKGYWFVASDGGIFSYGDAVFYGSTGNIHLNRPIVGMAANPDGHGYWLVASDGGIFSFGDAAFYGSTGAMHLNQPIVGMSPTPDGRGYWLVASDGGIFSFGDALFHGSTGATHLHSPIVGMTTTADGGGYWFTASDGGVFSFGDADFDGSLGGLGIDNVVGMAR